MFIRFVLIAVLVNLIGCAKSNMLHSSKFSADTVDSLVIANPITPSIKAQITMARIEQLMSQKESIPQEQLAELHYQRGVLYDSFGLDGLAQYDFTLALEYKPDMAKAFHFLGVQHTQNSQFMRAYEAFDSVLEIEPGHTYALLNRAIALYYGGREALAVDDIKSFYRQDPSDPYRVFWYYLLSASIQPKQSLEQLKEHVGLLPAQHWTQALFAVYLGEQSEDQFLRSLHSYTADNNQLAQILCEAYFYLGKWHRMNGRDNLALNYYKLSLSTNVFEFVEHRFARLELELMRASE